MRQPVLIASLVASAIYTATIPMGQFPGRWAVKTASVALLAVLARKHPLLALALALGSLGDLLLDLDPRYFLYGLVAFLCGHLVYVSCFARTDGRTPAAAAAILVLYAGAFLWWLWPSLGTVRYPVLVYIGAITLMAAMSFRPGKWVAAGAILFLISDSLLAANRFKTPLPLRDWSVWLTYYAGQYLIATGYLTRAVQRQPRSAAA